MTVKEYVNGGRLVGNNGQNLVNVVCECSLPSLRWKWTGCFVWKQSVVLVGVEDNVQSCCCHRRGASVAPYAAAAAGAATAAGTAAATAGDEEEVNVRVQGRGNCNLDKQKQSG